MVHSRPCAWLVRWRWQWQRGQVDMAFLGGGGDGHHYECVDAENGTLVRHFLRSAFAPGALPGRMEQCPAEARLEANAGAVYRLAPADLRAPPAQYWLPRSQSEQMRTCAAHRRQL